MLMSFSQNGFFHCIKSVSVVGGFLDKQTFDFSQGLNCIIGARGTGKTTILELIRYTMNALPADKTIWKRIESLVEQNLSGGRVEVAVDTKDGFSYVISRAIGEVPVVLTSNGEPTDINLTASGLFRINVFSQNEVESIADRVNSQLGIIDNFEAESLQTVEQEIRTVKVDLEANASKIIPLARKISAIHDELQVKPLWRKNSELFRRKAVKMRKLSMLPMAKKHCGTVRVEPSRWAETCWGRHIKPCRPCRGRSPNVVPQFLLRKCSTVPMAKP